MTIANGNGFALEHVTLSRGQHESLNEGACVMEVASLIAGEPFTDHPACVSPVIGGFLRHFNDGLCDEVRQRLLPFAPRIVGTAGDGKDELRGWLCVDWLVHGELPRWLVAAGAGEVADELRVLPPIRSEDAWVAARRVIGRGRDRLWVIRREAFTRVRDEARLAAEAKLNERLDLSATLDVAKRVAVDVAEHVASDIARVVADAADVTVADRRAGPIHAVSADSTMLTAGSFAGQVGATSDRELNEATALSIANAVSVTQITDSAWDPAYVAAYQKVRDAVADHIARQPRCVARQRSAFELLERLIDPVAA